MKFRKKGKGEGTQNKSVELLRRPTLLLCDEATSALDPLIERSVVEVIDAASRNVTTVMVAHKLQTVVDADLILVMQDGLLVEQGTHTSLLCQANSTYARMWAEQASGFDGAARGEDGVPVDYCKLALEDQRVPYVPWSAAPPARSKLPLCSWRARGHPPLQRPARLPRAARFLGPRGEPSPLVGRRGAAVAPRRRCRHTAAESTALGTPRPTRRTPSGGGTTPGQQTSTWTRGGTKREAGFGERTVGPHVHAVGVVGGSGGVPVSSSCAHVVRTVFPMYTWEANRRDVITFVR